MNAGAFGVDSDRVSVFIAAAPVELRRATDSPGIVAQNCAYGANSAAPCCCVALRHSLGVRQPRPLRLVRPPAVLLLVLRSDARDVRPEACVSFGFLFDPRRTRTVVKAQVSE